MHNFKDKLRNFFPKRYKGKRVQPKKSKFKTFLFKYFNIIPNVLSLLLVVLLVLFSYIGLPFKNSKKNQSKATKSISATIEENNNRDLSSIIQESVSKAIELENQAAEIIDIGTFEDNITPLENNENINLSVEISLLLEKNNMSYDDFIKLIYSPRYKDAFQKLINKYPNLTIENLINILKGNEVSLREDLYLGDSRTQGMLLSGAINENNTVYGVGYGYNWLVGKGDFNPGKTNAMSGAINGLESKMAEDKSYNIIIWLGVNDYGYISSDTYFQEFSNLATGKWQNHQIYIVSVGPVDDSRAVYVSNVGINNFNSSLKEKITNSGIANLNYIDLALTSDSINRYDGAGLHYGSNDYQNIHNTITSNIKENEKELSLDVLGLSYSALLDYDKLVSQNISESVLGNFR